MKKGTALKVSASEYTLAQIGSCEINLRGLAVDHFNLLQLQFREVGIIDLAAEKLHAMYLRCPCPITAYGLAFTESDLGETAVHRVDGAQHAGVELAPYEPALLEYAVYEAAVLEFAFLELNRIDNLVGKGEV